LECMAAILVDLRYLLVDMLVAQHLQIVNICA